MEYDATLKLLFENSARGLVRVLTGGEFVEWINVELPRVNLPRLDKLGRLESGLLGHLEFQTTNDPHLAERMALYYLEIRRKYGEHALQVVLYVGQEPVRMRSSIETPALRFEFRLVDIRELDGDALAAGGDVGDAMLAILARVRDQREAVHRALERIATLEGSERDVAVAQLAILAGLRGLGEIWKQEREKMPFEIDVMENEILRELYEKGLTEGEARGEARGRAEGRAEGEARGKAIGEANVLRTQMEKRFGPLPGWARGRLESATTQQIETWTLAVLDARTLEDVFGQG